MAIAVPGALVGLYLLAMLVKLPITARVVGQHILYDSPHFYVMTTMALYLIGTCASLMVSSHRRMAAQVAAFVSRNRRLHVLCNLVHLGVVLLCRWAPASSCCGSSVSPEQARPCHDESSGQIQARTGLRGLRVAARRA
ncbi:hypothetical protein ACPA9J_03555 [Pseudomonas aeruginosa]